MLLEEKIDTVLEHGESRGFLQTQLSTIRDNILEAEKRINKLFLFILSLIGLSVLMEMRVIKKIGFLSTEIENLNIVLIIMPCIIAYYTYSLFKQLLLRRFLNNLFTKIIHKKYPKVTEHDLDTFLITHMSDSIEAIMTRGKPHWTKRLIDILSAPFFMIYQYLPLWYCYYLICEMFKYNINKGPVWVCFGVTTLFFLRIIVLTVVAIKEDGGIKKIVKDIVGVS